MLEIIILIGIVLKFGFIMYFTSTNHIIKRFHEKIFKVDHFMADLRLKSALATDFVHYVLGRHGFIFRPIGLKLILLYIRDQEDETF